MWTADQLAAAGSYEGTCTSESQIAEALDLDQDEVIELMLDANIETCGGCEWWFEVCMLEYDEGRGKGFCQDCEPGLHEG